MTTPERKLAKHVANNLNLDMPMVRTRRDLEDHPLVEFEPLDVDEPLAAYQRLTSLAERHDGPIETTAYVSTINAKGQELMVDLNADHDCGTWDNAALCAAAEFLELDKALREVADRFAAITRCANRTSDTPGPAAVPSGTQ